MKSELVISLDLAHTELGVGTYSLIESQCVVVVVVVVCVCGGGGVHPMYGEQHVRAVTVAGGARGHAPPPHAQPCPANAHAQPMLPVPACIGAQLPSLHSTE